METKGTGGTEGMKDGTKQKNKTKKQKHTKQKKQTRPTQLQIGEEYNIKTNEQLEASQATHV